MGSMLPYIAAPWILWDILPAHLFSQSSHDPLLPGPSLRTGYEIKDHPAVRS